MPSTVPGRSWLLLFGGLFWGITVISVAFFSAPVSGIFRVSLLMFLLIVGPGVAVHYSIGLIEWEKVGSMSEVLRYGVIIVLILSISISPEIPLGFLAGGREFTLRLEDLVLVLVLVTGPGWIYLHPEFYLPPYFKQIFQYLLLAVSVTILSIGAHELSPARSFFYLFKEVEFFVFSLVIANAIRRKRELRLFILTILIGGLLNAYWAGLQLVTQNFGPLVYTVAIEKGRYGTSLLGQPAVLASGGYYLAPVFITLGLLVKSTERSHRIGASLLFMAFAGAMLGAVSRASIVATFTSTVLLVLWSTNLSTKRSVLPTLSLVLTPIVGVLFFVTRYFQRVQARFQLGNVIGGITDRVDQWGPLLDSAWPYAILGYGKGSLGQIIGFREAHNHSIRIFIEMGVLGIVVFALLILSVFRMSRELMVVSNDRHLQVIGIACVGVTISMVIISLVQDVFINVKVAEMFWLVVGATGAAWRIHREE